MIRFLIHAAIFIVSAALGLWITSLILADFEITVQGFVIAVAVFALAQAILAPFIFKMTTRYASAFVGGAGLVSTFVALLIASWVSDGLTVRGISTWVLGTLIVWLVSALATWLLPMWWLKNRVASS